MKSTNYGKYCVKGCKESEDWAAEYTDDIENSSSVLDDNDDNQWYYWIDCVSGDSDYIYDFHTDDTPSGLKVIPWEQYKAMLLSGKSLTNYEMY